MIRITLNKGLQDRILSNEVQKILKSDIIADFVEDIAQMKKLRHENLVQLYGMCTKFKPIWIVTEFMKHGSLLEYLAGDGRFQGIPQLIGMAAQVAAGMAYLEEHNYIHQDLGSRNILLSEHLTCKVAFGLSRLIDRGACSDGAVRWTNLEGMMYRNFTIKSDVWSFGILLYELVTYGSFPYCQMNNTQVLEALKSGYRLPCPVECLKKL